MTETLKDIMSRTLNIDKDNITDDMSYEETETWDSVAHLQLVSELETSFKTNFDIDEITAMESVKAIKDILAKHGVKIDEQ